MRDPYDILGVSTRASLRDIASAYHRRARETHPDMNPDADRGMFDEVTRAYALLRETARRREEADERSAEARAPVHPVDLDAFRARCREVVARARAVAAARARGR